MSEKSAGLFSEFSPPSYEEWVEATVQSLKGRPFETIKYQTVEGLTIRPFYTQADIVDQEELNSLPGQPPYRRGTRSGIDQAQPWLIAQALPFSEPEQFKRALMADLQRGQTAIYLDTAVTTCHNIDHLTAALKDVVLAAAPLFLAGGPDLLPVLADFLTQSGQAPADLRGGLRHDPLAALVRHGRADLDRHYEAVAQGMHWAVEEAPQFRTLAVDTAVYQNGGANAVQELAFALAAGVHHFRTLQAHQLPLETIAGQMWFIFALGGDFFMEIAKLRAARQLWAQVVAAFGGVETAQKINLHAETTAVNKSRLDPYVNMLRTTTETFAAAIAGVDSLLTSPYNQPFGPESDEFARRISRNQQLILQQEAGLTRLIDPAGGAYYAEWLTDRLAQKAWRLFQEIEEKGGLVATLQAGLPQQWVQATALARANQLAKRKDVLVGVNQFANVGERISTGSKEAPDAGSRVAPDLLQITPIKPVRLAKPYEDLRGWAAKFAEQMVHPPQIFLANMGPLRQYKARADFTRGFFAVGGFEMIYPDGFATPEAAAQATFNSGALAVVICSSDDTYPHLVPPLVQGIKIRQPAAIIILAGYPEDQVDALREAGVDAFIHLGADCLGMNRWLQEKLTVRQER